MAPPFYNSLFSLSSSFDRSSLLYRFLVLVSRTAIRRTWDLLHDSHSPKYPPSSYSVNTILAGSNISKANWRICLNSLFRQVDLHILASTHVHPHPLVIFVGRDLLQAVTSWIVCHCLVRSLSLYDSIWYNQQGRKNNIKFSLASQLKYTWEQALGYCQNRLSSSKIIFFIGFELIS